MRLEMKSRRLTASLCSRTKSKLLVEPAWLLKATQGEMTSMKAAPQAVRELAEPDRRGIPVARHAEINQVAVGKIGPGEHGRHAAVHRVEAMRVAKEIGRRLRRAADAGNLRHPVRLDRELEAGLNDGARDRIVTAAGAQGRHRAFIIAVRVAE